MRPEIVAELSCNHAGSLQQALALVDAAANAGADAIKLQTWTPGTMVLRQYLTEDGPWKGKDLAAIYREAHTPWKWIPIIFELARNRGIDAFATPFDLGALQELERHGCPRYKLASFELGDLALIRAIASTGKPIILSTGMATLEEIDRAVATATAAGTRREQLTLLKCTSGYPAPPEEANLATMRHMRSVWNCKVGLSDHSTGIAVALVAAAIGAEMIEKHLVLDGPRTYDQAFSITPKQLSELCTYAPVVGQVCGKVNYGPTPSEMPQLRLRRSLYFTRVMAPGETIAATDLVTARPALGIEPRFADHLVGRILRRHVAKHAAVTLEDLAEPNVTD